MVSRCSCCLNLTKLVALLTLPRTLVHLKFFCTEWPTSSQPMTYPQHTFHPIQLLCSWHNETRSCLATIRSSYTRPGVSLDVTKVPTATVSVQSPAPEWTYLFSGYYPILVFDQELSSVTKRRVRLPQTSGPWSPWHPMGPHGDLPSLQVEYWASLDAILEVSPASSGRFSVQYANL
jgi:hypothetical protein